MRLINIVSNLQDRLAGSAFALAIQSLLVFGSLTLFLCSPCLSLIFFGYYLGYCPTGVVDRSKGGSGGGGVGVGGGDEKEVVAQQMIVVEKRSKRGESRELPTRSGKSKRKRKALKISEAQAQVLGEWFTFEFCILFLNFEIKSSPSQSTDAAAAPSHCVIGRIRKTSTTVKIANRTSWNVG